MGRRAYGVYLASLVLASLAAFVLASVGRMTLDNIRCKSDGYGRHTFLAYCVSPHFGDYEHGAFYFGLEPEVGHRIARAKVLFLGNSLIQATFSSAATREYFAARKTSFFIMGFGYGEWSTFSLAVLRRWGATPRVLVINADPFFKRELSVPAREALGGDLEVRWRSFLKMASQRVQRFVCSLWPCPNSERSIFRSAHDGQWDWVGPYIPNRSLPIDTSQQATLAGEALDSSVAVAKTFLDSVGVRRECVVLTGIPTAERNGPAMASALAARLNLALILLPTDGLRTVDGSHLNRDSAEHWSAEFLKSLTPLLQRCLQEP